MEQRPPQAPPSVSTPIVPSASNVTGTTPLTTRPTEHGGPKGLEPTRYGDWERNGRCIDF
jgi:hypothetical protein